MTDNTQSAHFQLYRDILDSFKLCIRGSRWKAGSLDILPTEEPMLQHAQALLEGPNYSVGKEVFAKVIEEKWDADKWQKEKADALLFFLDAVKAIVDVERAKLIRNLS